MTDIEELRRLCEAATPGPWHTHEEQVDAAYYDGDNQAQHHIVADTKDIQRERYGSEGDKIANACLVSAARNAIPALLAEIEQLRAVVDRTVATLRGIDASGVRAGAITAPEDVEVLAICERVGYGAVMDSAQRLWWQKDHDGCLTVGPCAVTVRDALAAAKGGTDVE